MQALRFSEIERFLQSGQPGLYEVHTVGGVKLKVGIAGDLLKRLKQHRASRDSGLKLRPGGDRSNPKHVDSKSSVLAKHLYYDETISPDHDLKSELGRRGFLEECCVLIVEPTESREAARQLELAREADGGFRYVGEVRVRRG